MDLELKETRALVTGASKGLGRTCAGALAAEWDASSSSPAVEWPNAKPKL